MRTSLGVALLVVAAGCTPPQLVLPIPAVRLPTADLTMSMFLIGDAGAAAADGDRVLVHLRAMVHDAPADTAVVFLGDNIYPHGLPPADDRGYADAERRLLAQVDAVRRADRVVFIPGNHDWTQTGAPRDWDAVLRQDQRLRAEGFAISPRAGCPGPEVIDLGPHLRVVALDTEWWLHGFPAPRDAGCPHRTVAEVLGALDAAIRVPDGRHVVIAAHHPPISAGPHGGYFDWQDHLFPLREVAAWLWVPVPGLGSAYPLLRRTGLSAQDQAHPANRRLMASLKARLEAAPPLLYAAGHEHQLNLFTGETIGTRFVAVSGAGMAGHERDAIGRPDGLLFGTRTPGFMRLDIFADASVRLQVITIPSGEAGRTVHEAWLR